MQMKSLQWSTANSHTTNQNIRTDGVKAYIFGKKGAPTKKKRIMQKAKTQQQKNTKVMALYRRVYD